MLDDFFPTFALNLGIHHSEFLYSAVSVQKKQKTLPLHILIFRGKL